MFSGKKIFFARICGTGMSSLAITVKRLGAYVYGFDEAFYPPVSTALESEDIPLLKPEMIDDVIENDRPDIIVIGNALRGKSAEAMKLIDSGIDYYSMPSFMEEFLIPGHRSIVAAGTHGKTTTSTIISEFLSKHGMKPSYLIGGIPLFSMTNAAYEKDGYFVIEGDEYDTAFFDKGPKFLHYKPDISIVTSIEFDHADIYSSIDAIFENFRKLVKITGKRVVISTDFENNRKLIGEFERDRFFTYSVENSDSDLFLKRDGMDGRRAIFSYYISNEPMGSFTVSLFGKQNLMNIAALLSFIHVEKIEIERGELQRILNSFEGIKRRQEYLGTINSGLIFNDFAHHPTAVDLTLSGFRDAFPEREIFILFDPATNSNSRKLFEKRYESIFLKADKVVIGKPAKLDRVPPEERFSPVRVVDNIERNRGDSAFYFEKSDDILRWLRDEMSENSIAVIMSNGSFSGLFNKLPQILDQGAL